MRHGSLFSGIGGFDLAAQWMGWENVFHCEWNPFGHQIFNSNKHTRLRRFKSRSRIFKSVKDDTHPTPRKHLPDMGDTIRKDTRQATAILRTEIRLFLENERALS